MEIPFWQVDAFASQVFRGNPAGVCMLDEWIADDVMQAIARENGLSETAFFVPAVDGMDGASQLVADGGEQGYAIRWFAPAREVDLCGHATLAAGHVVLGAVDPRASRVEFASNSGLVSVAREQDLLYLDFPARPAQPCRPPSGLEDVLGAQPSEVLRARDLMVVFDDEETVRTLTPDLERIAYLDCFAVIATAPGCEADFVSRFFAPAAGIPEDPVTGSAHCTLVPYWSNRLGKERLRAFQLSERGGELWCRDEGQRVAIGGRAVTYLTGTIFI